MVDLKDPIQVHLLTETALLDSKQFEILSQEEVDGLKKQCQWLSQRIEQTRANLAIQTKYRDAAISMSKLYSTQKGDGKRRSLLGNRNSNGDTAREAELERQASERRCEELASELWSLEKRLMEPQRRLLEHTAGILQLTHKASKRPAGQQPNGLMPNGMPGSPESMYTYSNSQNSMDPGNDDGLFDDQYQRLDQMDSLPALGPGKNNGFDIPTKSPVREQNSQLQQENDRLAEENGRLRDEAAEFKAQVETLEAQVSQLQRESAQWLRTIQTTEQKLDLLNNSLRDTIIRMNPQKNANYKAPPYGLSNGSDRSIEPGDLIGSQLDYLERGFVIVTDGQELQANEKVQEAEAAAAAAAVDLAQAEGRIEAINRRVRDMLQSIDPTHPPPPQSSGSGLDEQFQYLQESLRIVEGELYRAAEASSASTADKLKVEQMETVMMSLWDTIQTGYRDIQKRKEDRRRMRTDKGLTDDDDELSADEGIDTNEQYSLAGFSSRIKWLYKEATSLKEQKGVLKRQIKQQRELNNKSSSEKDAELQKKDEDLRRKNEEMQELRQQLEAAEEEADEANEKLLKALTDLDSVQKTRKSEELASLRAEQEKEKEQEAKLASVEAIRADLEAKLAKAEAEVTSVTAQLKEAEAQQAAAANSVAEKQAELKEKEDEIDRLNLMVAELKTEVTIARAELDGAYGSRRERAAEVAALQSQTAASQQTIELQQQVDRLRGELSDALAELQELTRETLTSEKERIDLENKLDDAVAERARLEAEMAAIRDRADAEVRAALDKADKLQEQLDAAKLAGGSGAAAGGGKPTAGASMLSEQFRATMREERKKFQEDLRVC